MLTLTEMPAVFTAVSAPLSLVEINNKFAQMFVGNHYMIRGSSAECTVDELSEAKMAAQMSGYSIISWPIGENRVKFMVK